MTVSRGRGKVVPRQQHHMHVRKDVSLASSLPALPASPDVFNVQQAPQLPGHSSPAAVSTQALTVSTPRQDNEGAVSEWRCADYVTKNSKQVPSLAASKLGTAASKQMLSGGQPVLLPQLQLARCSLETHWKQQQQRPMTHGQATGQHQVTVLCSPAASNRFVVSDASKNMPGSYYHLRKPETSSLSMSFTQWLGCWQTWQQSKLLLMVRLFERVTHHGLLRPVNVAGLLKGICKQTMAPNAWRPAHCIAIHSLCNLTTWRCRC